MGEKVKKAEAVAAMKEFERSKSCDSIHVLRLNSQGVRAQFVEAGVWCETSKQWMRRAWERVNAEGALASVEKLEAIAFGGLEKKDLAAVAKKINPRAVGRETCKVGTQVSIAKDNLLLRGESPEVVLARLFSAEEAAKKVLEPKRRTRVVRARRHFSPHLGGK